MAHTEQRMFFERVRSRYPQFFHNQNVLEFGSLNINGSIRSFFTDCKFTGIDLGPGPGVDVVINGKDFVSDELYSVTISTECFEHNPQWIETFQNMIKLTNSKGMIIVTAASTGRPEHGTNASDPSSSPFTASLNYYRNVTIKHFVNEWNFDQLFSNYIFEYTNVPGDLYFYGILK